MTRKLQMNLCKRFLVVLLVICIGVFAIYITSFATEKGNGRQIIVSLGDSYSSGEGIEPFYGQNENISKRVKNPDWLAHRSENAWSGMLTLPSVKGKMSENRNKHWYFVAASGAVIDNLFYEQRKDFKKGKDLVGWDYLQPQLEIFNKLGAEKADYVTLTLGGNNVGFAKIVTQCVIENSHLNPNHLTDRINNTWKEFFMGGIRDRLFDTYVEIAKRAGSQAQIIVVGYPKLLDTAGHPITDELPLNKVNNTLKNKELV